MRQTACSAKAQRARRPAAIAARLTRPSLDRIEGIAHALPGAASRLSFIARKSILAGKRGKGKSASITHPAQLRNRTRGASAACRKGLSVGRVSNPNGRLMTMSIDNVMAAPEKKYPEAT